MDEGKLIIVSSFSPSPIILIFRTTFVLYLKLIILNGAERYISSVNRQYSLIVIIGAKIKICPILVDMVSGGCCDSEYYVKVMVNTFSV